MSDVKRWLDEGAPSEVARLLAAGLQECPHRAGVQRTLLAVGITSAAATATNLASATSSASSGALGASSHFASPTAITWVAKWALLGVVGVGAVIATTGVVLPAHDPNAAGLAAASRLQPLAPLHPVIATATASNGHFDNLLVTPSANPASVRAGRSSGGAPSAAAATSADRSVAQEISLIDQARAALRSGNANTTLRLVNDYIRRFPAGRFAPEALYLKMEAQLNSGDQQDALLTAHRLVERYPQCPQVGRAKEILNSTNYPHNL